MKKREEEDDDYIRYLSLIGVPFLLVIAPICGYFLGHYSDHYFGTAPYLTYFGLALGVIAAVREFYRLVKEFTDDE